jgi:hypothetical protein
MGLLHVAPKLLAGLAHIALQLAPGALKVLAGFLPGAAEVLPGPPNLSPGTRRRAIPAASGK